MIAIEHGCFRYKHGAWILEDLSFSLEGGKVMSILGPNGIGKTTLLKCMIGILKWNSGHTVIDGKVWENPLASKQIGYVPQAHPVAFSYSVEELVIMGRANSLPMFAVPAKSDWERAYQAMEEVGICDIAGRSCGQLSGGQLQLAFIARALAGDPKILILDEPESHLDFKNQFLILNLIQKLVAERGISCILNTHYPEHALRIADKTLLLGRGRHLFGDTGQIISQENMNAFFDIQAKILDFDEDGFGGKAFVVVDSLPPQG